jgi:4-carboxymuconolactone decarboxylase
VTLALPDRPVAVIGGGPAGLTAAYELTKRAIPAVVFEADAQVGGLAKTAVYKGFRFDIGGHRFFTKVPAVSHLWHELLGPDLLRRPRLSRIYYGGRVPRGRGDARAGGVAAARPAPHQHANGGVMRLRRRIPIVLILAAAAAAAQTPLRDVKLVGDRFRPLAFDEMTPEQRTMIEHVVTGERASTGGPFNVLLRSPQMGDAAQQLGAQVRFHSSLPNRLKEMAILIVARHWTSHYEWYAHKRLALEAGLPPAMVEAIRSRQTPAGMAPQQKALYDFERELLDTHQVSDPTFRAAVAAFGERGVVDLIGLMGYYHLVSMALNVDRYPLPPGEVTELR